MPTGGTPVSVGLAATAPKAAAAPAGSTTSTASSVAALNAARQAAVDSGKSAYGGNLASLATFSAGNSNGGTAPPGTAATSSAPNVAGEANTLSDINGLKTPSFDLGGYASTITEALNSIKAYGASLDANYATQTANLNNTFGAQEGALVRSNQNQEGAEASSLQRIGGGLGESASGTGALNNMIDDHQAALSALAAQKATALQQATSAYNASKFDVAKEATAQAMAIQDRIYKTQQDAFTNSLSYIQAKQSAQSFAASQAKDTLAMLGTLPVDQLDQIPQSTLDTIDGVYGVPGFAKQYVAAVSQSNTVKSEQDAVAYQKNLVEMLQDIPAGQTVKFPDGTQYTGIGKTSDISTYMVTDNSGNAHVVTYNKGSGQTSTISVGHIGKSSASTGGSASDRMTPVSSTIKGLLATQNGKLTASQYTTLYQTYITQNPGKGSEFTTAFNPGLLTGTDIAGITAGVGSGDSAAMSTVNDASNQDVIGPSDNGIVND